MKMIIAMLSVVLIVGVGCSGSTEPCLNGLEKDPMVVLNDVSDEVLCSLQNELTAFVMEELEYPDSYEPLKFAEFFVTEDGYELKHSFRAKSEAGSMVTKVYHFRFSKEPTLLDFEASAFLLAVR